MALWMGLMKATNQRQSKVGFGRTVFSWNLQPHRKMPPNPTHWWNERNKLDFNVLKYSIQGDFDQHTQTCKLIWPFYIFLTLSNHIKTKPDRITELRFWLHIFHRTVKWQWSQKPQKWLNPAALQHWNKKWQPTSPLSPHNKFVYFFAFLHY